MVTSARRWATASVGLLLAAGTIAAVGATAAGNPTVGVGGAAPSSASYSGNVGPGNPDVLGPPAPACQQDAGCQRQAVVLKAPNGWTDTHSITLGVAIDYPGAAASAPDDLDVGIFDAQGDLLASDYAVSEGQVVAAANVPPGTYTIEVDGDITVTPQDYTAHVTAASAPKYVPAPRKRGGLRFATTTLTDPFRLGTEPNIAVAPDNKTLYESPIFGFSTTQSFLSRSTDGGRTFNVLGVPGAGKLDQCTGGGDSDIATDRFGGDIYMIDLGGAPEVPARVSHDRGVTFASSCEANFNDGANYFTDRQWLSTDLKHKVMWYIYRDGVVNTNTLPVVQGTELGKQGYGEFLKYAPLPTKAGTAGAAQLKFKNICDNTTGVATPCFDDLDIAGNPVTDNTPTSRHYGTTYLAVERSQGVSVARFTTSKNSVHEFTVAKGRHQVLFPTVAVDRAGTVYMAWTDVSNYRVYLSHTKGHTMTSSRCSSTVTTNCWTKPVVVNGAPVTTTVMPWVVAGSKGRIDVVFYGTANPKAPTLNYGPWYPYMAQSLDATKAKPTFTQVRMTDHPNHIDPVCLSGLGCTTDTGPGGDRELGDFFRVVVDGSGRALVSFADGDNQLGKEVANGPLAAPSFADFARQSTGPSLYKSVGLLRKVPSPKQCVTVGPHHNPVPFVVPGAGAQGSDVKALQLRGSCLKRLSNGNLRATITLASLNPSAATSPPALPTATYMVRWVYRHHVWFGAAEYNAGSGTWRYFSGAAAPVSDGLAIKYAYYPASGKASGSTDSQSKTIAITIPRDQVGSPPAGAKLSTVTAFALTHASPTAPTSPSASNFTDLPQVADVLPAYTATLSAPKRSAAVPPAGTPTVRGPLPLPAPSPVLPLVAGLLAVAGLGCAAAARRARAPQLRLA